MLVLWERIGSQHPSNSPRLSTSSTLLVLPTLLVSAEVHLFFAALGTVFAYGQTGTGKTFTMVGSEEVYDLRGMIPRAFEQIFDSVDNSGGKNITFLVRCSFLEIYNEEIRDLLGRDPKKRLELKDNPDSGVYVKDLSAIVVKTVLEMQQVVEKEFPQFDRLGNMIIIKLSIHNDYETTSFVSHLTVSLLLSSGLPMTDEHVFLAING